jgi:hypothetical protein
MRLDDGDEDDGGGNYGGGDIQIPEWGMTRDAMGLGVGDYVAAAGEAVEAEEPKEEKEYFVPRMLPSRRRELKELKKPGPRSTCFMCCYTGERNTLLPGDDVNKMVDYIRKHVGRMDTIAMATQVATFYAAFRARINSQLQAGEQALPVMTAATVIDHCRNHHHDPEMKVVMILDELQELRQEILKGVLEKSSKTGKTRANKNQVDCLEKVIKTELTIQARDTSKLNFYSAGAHIDPTLHKQGVVATSTKNMFSKWRKLARPV